MMIQCAIPPSHHQHITEQQCPTPSSTHEPDQALMIMRGQICLVLDTTSRLAVLGCGDGKISAQSMDFPQLRHIPIEIKFVIHIELFERFHIWRVYSTRVRPFIVVFVFLELSNGKPWV